MNDATRPDRSTLPLDVLDRIDLLCNRFEAAWESGARPRLEDLLAEVDGPYRPPLLRDLLAAELDARRRRGERPEPAEYLGRFPDDPTAVESAFAPATRTAGAGVGRDLLFGLLAFQTGQIDHAALIDALQDLAGARTLAEALADRGALDPERRALLEGLLAEHLRRHDGDLNRALNALPVGRSALERLGTIGLPDLQATLTRLAGSEATGLAADLDRTTSFAVDATASDAQRFRVVRPHASGGLGAVFLAIDRELPREVALKQILDRHADDPVSRSRFLAEAEITGGLEHPGIVPVYGLGTYTGGRPYYAMRFIRGDSLKDAINQFHNDPDLRRDPGRRSLALRKLLGRFLDVCNAIEYAHSRGVLHRDIKPGNVIVGKHGETLVIDWGLAKATGRPWDGSDPSEERPLAPPSAGGSAETQPGNALGTPAFMSPEQAAGEVDRLGPRSDVYALGATLFSLLTGRAPFEGGPVHAILRAVREGNFPPPSTIDSAVPRPLEAICLKAMARRPEDRYQTARALAEDIERWLADEPVAAHRESPAARARRWARRHRTLVTSAGVGLVLTSLSLALGVALLGRAYQTEADLARDLSIANGRINRRNSDLLAANAATRKAEQLADSRLDRAMKAIEEYHTGVSAEALKGDQLPPALRARLLARPRQFYEELNRELAARPDPSIRERRLLGRGQFNLAKILAQLGQKDEALQQYQASIATLKALIARDPDEPAHRRNLSTGYSSLGLLFRSMGRSEDAIRALRDSLAIARDLAARHPDDRRYRDGLASGHTNLGAFLFEIGQFARAAAEDGEAIATYRELVRRHPDDDSYRNRLATCQINLGGLLADTGDRPRAADLFREAIRGFQALLARHPDDPGYLDRLATTQTNLLRLLLAIGRPAEAVDVGREGLVNAGRLVAREPGVPDHRELHAKCRYALGTALVEADRPADGEAEFRLAIGEFRKLLAGHRDQPVYQFGLSVALNNLGDLQASRGQHEAAESSAREAVDLLRAVVDRSPRVIQYRQVLATEYALLARLLRASGRAGEAAEVARRWAELCPGQPGQLYNAACALAGCLPIEPDPDRRRDLGNEAVATLRDAIAAGWSDAVQAAHDPDFGPLRDRDDFRGLLAELFDRSIPQFPFLN